MKILLSYSRYHYDPSGRDKGKSLPLKGTSARVIASSLHKILLKLGKVTYIDPLELNAVKGLKFDVFIGQIQNFSKIAESIESKRNILLAVNSHPSNRNKSLKNFLNNNNLEKDSIAPGEIVDIRDFSKSIKLADQILCVGNNDVYNSYIKNKVPYDKIKMVNYGVGLAEPKIKKTSNTKRILYAASEIGLRKGFDIFCNLVLENKNMDFTIDIVGKPSNVLYEKKLEELIKKFGERCKYHGWVSSETKKYDNLIKKSDFILAPSLEEGQLGVALEAMHKGVVPVLSTATGIDFSPYGFLELKINSTKNDILFKRIINSNNLTVDKFKQETIKYYKEFHEEYMDNLEEDIIRIVDGSVYPRFSIVLPIHNKEKTILPLIKLLHASLVNYKNVELTIIFDGCKDNTEKLVRKYYSKKKYYEVKFLKTNDIFEVKSNNVGLKLSKGDYCVIVQDDNYIYDRNFIFEAANFLTRNKKAAVLGCLAGVNFYPKGTPIIGKGQLVQNTNETYWRQDEKSNPDYANEIFQVDACMRGPLIIRGSFLKDYGYFDEKFAPLYMDDMDLCFRAMSHGYKNYCILSDVENMSFTISNYDAEKNKFWDNIIAKNTEIFYERWKPSTNKNYTKINRIKIYDNYRPKRYKNKVNLVLKIKNAVKEFAEWRHILNDKYSEELSNSRWKKRMNWVIAQAESIPAGSKVLDVGAGQTLYRKYFQHTKYLAQDFAQTPDFEYGKIDILSDITDIPLPSSSQDYILCTEVFEHIPYPEKALKEISRLLKKGGKLIFTAPLGSGQHQAPYHFYGGYTRYWYQKFFAENDLSIEALIPNGGLNSHLIEMLWRTNESILPKKKKINIFYTFKRKIIQIFMYNIPSIKLHKEEKKYVNEDFTACFFCVAQKNK